MEAHTHGHVNFTSALVRAFGDLTENRINRGERSNNINFKDSDKEPYNSWAKHLYGSNCKKEEPNQAVIMITDGIPDR